MVQNNNRSAAYPAGVKELPLIEPFMCRPLGDSIEVVMRFQNTPEVWNGLRVSAMTQTLAIPSLQAMSNTARTGTGTQTELGAGASPVSSELVHATPAAKRTAPQATRNNRSTRNGATNAASSRTKTPAPAEIQQEAQAA